MRRTRRGISRTEALIGLAVILVLGVMAVPLAFQLDKRAKRSQVEEIVDQIRTAELARHEGYGSYLEADASPRSAVEVDADAVAWTPSPGFATLRFRPTADALRGSFRVELTDNDFLVVGECDVDGDGERARFEASADRPATLMTPQSRF